MQLEVDRFSKSCQWFGLKIILRKTETMFQPSPYSSHLLAYQHVKIGDTELTILRNFATW